MAARSARTIVRQRYPVPTSWSELPQEEISPESFVQWWNTFNDPVLDSLIMRAVPSNLDLRIAEVRVREGADFRGAVASDLWSSLDTSASYSEAGAAPAFQQFHQAPNKTKPVRDRIRRQLGD